MLTFTSRQTRWIGLGGLGGGLLWAIWIFSLMQRSRTDAMPAWGQFVPALAAALLVTGLVGILTSYREQIAGKGAVGIWLLIGSMVSYSVVSALADWRLHDPFKSVLGLGVTILPIPGFILIGLALKGLARAGAFLIAVVGLAAMVLPAILSNLGVADSLWLRGDAQVTPTWGVYFMLAAAWLAVAGYLTSGSALRQGAVRRCAGAAPAKGRHDIALHPPAAALSMSGRG